MNGSAGWLDGRVAVITGAGTGIGAAAPPPSTSPRSPSAELPSRLRDPARPARRNPRPATARPRAPATDHDPFLWRLFGV
jgi:hypothetical protein